MSYLPLLVKRYKWLFIPFTAYYISEQCEKYYDSQMTLFRDMSALYGSEKAKGEPPSW